jgi:hypothetical protein
VTPVQGRDLGDAESFGEADDGGVHRAQRQVRVLVHERGSAGVVGRLEIDDLEVAGAERAQERCLGIRALAGGEQLADLDDNRGGMSIGPGWFSRRSAQAWW